MTPVERPLGKVRKCRAAAIGIKADIAVDDAGLSRFPFALSGLPHFHGSLIPAIYASSKGSS
jgi:hypothetical protein